MSARHIPIAVMRLGHIVATANARLRIPNDEILKAIARHQAGDWGELSQEDRAANDHALSEGTRILSRYHATDGMKFWIITEADRSVTTILLPEDY